MKNLIKVLASVLLVSGLVSCDELRTFSMDYAVDFTIPSSTVLNLPLNLPSPPVTTNSEQRFQDEGVESAWIESIRLTDITITITAPQGEDFSFLQSVAIYITSPGQAEVLLAQRTDVPENAGNVLVLDATGEDLYPYISTDDFTLRTSVTTDESLLQDVDFRADLEVQVKATIPGI